MKLDRSSFAETPERILDAAVDCVWVVLAPRQTPSPLKSASLEWLDWKLSGRISRTLFDEAQRPGSRAWYLPTMKRIKAPYVAVSTRPEGAAAELLNSAEGLKWQQVLLFFEDPALAPEFEKSLRACRDEASVKSGAASLSLTLSGDGKIPGPEREA